MKISLIQVLMPLVLTRLVVHGPQELKNKFESNEYRIRASYANFGNIPYG